ncbi:MAG: alpha/beta hydrolase [Gammaproteobacteria bacterium]|nr:alpha/beta hydrolase [Gammaproteobacteria bacterium]
MEFSVDGKRAYAYTGARAFDPEKPSVIFIHGGGLDHCVWILQSRYFAHHGYNALAVDLPGHGRSEGPLQTSIEAMADWVGRAADALKLGRYAIAGHSMGALVGLETAARDTDRVAVAVLIGISVPMPVTGALLSAAKANDHAAFDMVNLWGHGYGAQLGGNPSPGMWMTGGAVRLLERSGPGVLYNDLNACNEYRDGLESAAKVKAPARVILGTNDIMASPRAAREVIKALSQVEVTELSHCGHMLMAEQPDQVLEAMMDSVSRYLSATAHA